MLSTELLIVIISLILFLIPSSIIPSLTGPAAAVKKYSSFNQFYPFYLIEHSNRINRRLHVIGTSIIILLLVWYPTVAISLLATCAIGSILSPIMIGTKNGIAEVLGMLVVYITLLNVLGSNSNSNNNNSTMAALIPLIGYGFAWIGHFQFQRNRPATFIYPAYSLMGDFKMWAQYMTLQLK